MIYYDSFNNYFYLATLPLIVSFSDGPNTHHFNNAVDLNKICNQFFGKRGIYLWTYNGNGNENGYQYIGSSKNLGKRLKNYYSNSKLKYQSGKGSAISSALLKYEIASFSLSVLVLGPTFKVETEFSSKNLPDYVKLEQIYLDKYTLAFNVKRYATFSKRSI